MNQPKKKVIANKVYNRFLPITQSVLKGLEREPKITDFTILKILGEGSFSKVYLAQHNKTQAQYAIKAIDKRNQENVDEKDYFKREAEIMYRIHHPNIVKLYGHFEDNTYCYFIMEYMSGGNAYSLVPKHGFRKISDQQVASILKDVISATYYLHHMVPPIIHRDIKPENVLFNSEMKAKLTDFGWSNYLNKSNMKRMTMCGTPIYLAPELVNNFGHDHRVDIWCIGVLMFELLTGQPPWMGNDVQTLKFNIARMKIRWQKNMDLDAVDLLKKTLRYNPEERISLRNMLMHPFFTKYYPDAVNSLIRPDGSKPRIYIISQDNPQINYYSSPVYVSNVYDNNNNNNNIIYNNNNNYNISYISNSNSNNIIDNNNIINNYNYTSVNEIPYTPPITITSTSYPTPTLQQSNYIPSINTYNNIFTNEKIEYSNAPLNSLNIQELIENQERIDELVKKTEPKKNIFQSSYETGYNYNSDYQLNNRPYLYQTPSIYKTQSPLYYNFNQVNQVQYNKGIKYSLPTKYSVEPIKYNKPKIIYSSMTARRNFEGNKYKSSSRLFNNLFSKYGMNLK